MTSRGTAARHVVALWALCLLAGCVGGLLGGGKPDELFRFGTVSPGVVGVARPQAAGPRVLLAKVAFASEVDGDRLLAVHGTSVRYIKGMRWVTGASELFAEAVVAGFQAGAPDLVLVREHDGRPADYSLVVRVDRFEARFGDEAMTSPPTVVIAGEATLSRLSDRPGSATHRFAVEVVADQARAGAVAAAFDAASTQSTAQITDWVKSAATHRPQ